jgi:predicted Zn-dependent protease
MDLAARARLIDQLTDRGQYEEAIHEYLELADMHCRLAELDLARKTYATALRLIQRGNVGRDWNVHILQRMADIDLQRLDWKQALRIFEQIRTLQPGDDNTRKQLVELNLRLGQQGQAMSELENYLAHLESNHTQETGVIFLEEVIKDHPDQLLLKRALAEQLRRAGRIEEAVSQLDALGEQLVQSGRKKEAFEVINQIVLMNPPNVEDYRQLLQQMQAG